jgi:hypothetical protein
MTVNQQFVANQVGNLPEYQNTYGQGSDNTANVTFVGNWGARFDLISPYLVIMQRSCVPGLDVVFLNSRRTLPSILTLMTFQDS